MFVFCNDSINRTTFEFTADSRNFTSNIQRSTEIGSTASLGVPTLGELRNTMSAIVNSVNYTSCPVNPIPQLTPIAFDQTIDTGANQVTRFVWYSVINSSNGEITFNVSFNGLGAVQFEGTRAVTLFPKDEPTAVSELCDDSFVSASDDGFQCNDTITVDRNREYVFAVGRWDRYNTTSTVTFVNPILNISIDTFQPQFLCGEFTECNVNTSTRQRICVDQLGVAADIVEVEACFPEAFEEAVLGFEDFTEFNVIECKKDGFTCIVSPQNQSIRIPNNWTVGFTSLNTSGQGAGFPDTSFFPRFVDMQTPPPDSSGRLAAEGSLSLFLWYSPPNIDQPQPLNVSAGTITCGNETTGRVATVRRDLNATIFTDVTFPSPFAALRWEARKFTSNVVQYQVSNPFCTPFQQLCYGLNCTEDPLGNYQFNILEVDTSTGLSTLIFQYFAIATEDWDETFIDLTNLNLVVGRTYRLVFAVIPPDTDVFREEGVGVAFDNVRIQNLPTEIATCTEFCNGTSLFTPSETSGVCTFEIDLNNSFCEALVIVGATGLVANQTIFEPLQIFEDVNITGIFNSLGIGQFNSVLSVFFIVIIIILSISGYLELKLGGGKGVVFGVTLLTLVIAFATLGLFPISAMIVLIIVAGLIIVWTLFKGFGGT